MDDRVIVIRDIHGYDEMNDERKKDFDQQRKEWATRLIENDAKDKLAAEYHLMTPEEKDLYDNMLVAQKKARDTQDDEDYKMREVQKKEINYDYLPDDLKQRWDLDRDEEKHLDDVRRDRYEKEDAEERNRCGYFRKMGGKERDAFNGDQKKCDAKRNKEDYEFKEKCNKPGDA